MPALYFALKYQVGFEFELLTAEEGLSELKPESLKYQEEIRMPMEIIFKHFNLKEEPFGKPDEEWHRISFKTRSKSFQMRETPYKAISDFLYDSYKTGALIDSIQSAMFKWKMTYQLTGEEDLVTLADIAEMAIDIGHE